MKDFKNFILWGSILFPSMIIVNTLLFEFVFAPKESFFLNLAASVVISWLLVLTIYYVWAIYFYNINLGWTDKDWKEKETKVLVTGSADEPDQNPNREETLGLPPGTVRSTIALSILVCGVAMMIASFAMPGKLKQNEFIIDHFEFLKTAFLMMIAFYFGSKSLELLKDRKMIDGIQGPANQTNSPTAPTETVPVNTTDGKIIGDVAPVSKSGEADFHDPNSKG